jgi:hypothetical protein
MAETLYKGNTSGYATTMPKAPFSLRFDPEIMDKMTVHAGREGRSRNSLIEWIMKAYDSDPKIQDLVRQHRDEFPEA